MVQSWRVSTEVRPRAGWLPRPATWLALLLFTALTVLLSYPLALRLSSLRFPTGPDGELGWYLLGWDAHAFFHRPWAIFDANIYYPQRLTLAYGENLIGIALLVAPVLWITDDLLVTANVGSLLSCILCGLGAYVLARRVGLSAAAGVICGIIFLCAPPRFFRIGQINLSSVQWIPFALAYLHTYLDTGRRRDLRLAALFVAMEVLSSGHGAVFMVVALAIFGAYRVALGEPIWLMTRLRDLGVVGAAPLVLSALIFLPYRAVQQEVGLRRGLGSWEQNYSAFIASPAPAHRYLMSLITDQDPNRTASSYLFPGYLPIVLTLVAVALGGAAALQRVTLPRLSDWKPTLAAIGDVYRRPALCLVGALLVSTALSALRPQLPAGTGLRAQYYQSAQWAGPPIMSTVDLQPSTAQLMDRWNDEPPAAFSVTWSGYISILRPGLYFFATTSEDRSRMFIDNELVVNNPGGFKNGQAGSVRLTQGPHLVVLEYEHGMGRTGLKWEWIYDGDSDKAYKVIQPWALSLGRVDTTTVIVTRVVDALRPIVTALVALSVLWCIFAVPIRRHAVWDRSFETGRREATGLYLLLTLTCIALALGPPYGLWRFVYWMPVFNLIRGSARFMILGLLGFAMLAAIGFDRLTRRVSRPGRVALATAISILLVVEYAGSDLGLEPARIEIPAIDRWLDTRPKPFVVAEAPVHEPGVSVSERYETAYMVHSTAHWQKTVHGYSGWRAILHMELYSQMQNFPDETSITSLSDLGVTYVVVHSDMYSAEEWPKVEARLDHFTPRLRLEHTEGAGRVYSLVRGLGTRD
jgi:PA14 domain-containing protein